MLSIQERIDKVFSIQPLNADDIATDVKLSPIADQKAWPNLSLEHCKRWLVDVNARDSSLTGRQ